MRCCVPFCRSTADQDAAADKVTFHSFPMDATLRAKWLRALGKHDQPLKNSAVVCSQHFLDEDFCNIEGGSRQVRLGVVPSTVKLCMICLDTDRNVASLSKYNLEDAYEKLTGYSICREGYLKQTLCKECAQRLINFDKFRSKSLKARSAMMDLVKMHETITIRHIKQINDTRELLKSQIGKTTFAPDHCDLHIKESNYGDRWTKPQTVMPPDPIDVVKIEHIERTLDERDIRPNLKEAKNDNGDINIERWDSTACINETSDASVLLDINIIDESLSTELDLDMTIKAECSDDAYNGHNDDARHEECGSEECDTQLAHRTHTALHSQHSETYQVPAGDSSADYPHTSVKLVPIQVYELPSEKKNRVETNKALFKNCVIESEPKSDETKNFETLDVVNETGVNFVKTVIGKLQVNPIAVSETLNKQNLLQDYDCDHCEYKCSERETIVKHLKNHTINERLSSSSYDRVRKIQNSLAKHMKIHVVEKPFSCKLCAYTSEIKGNLINHMKIHTGEKPFSCEVCEYVCSRKEHLVRHTKIHTGEKPFSCKFCEYVCRRKEHLEKHTKIHTGEKPFSCKFCSYACRKKEHLVRHTRIHTGEKPFSCSVCDYAGRTKIDLVEHTRIHSGERPFSCNLCEFACGTKRSLVRHMTIHTAEKPFSCQICEYACGTRGDLVRHTRIHTGEKPFSCKLCDYACRRQGDLVRHMKIHNGEKPLPCKLCGYASKSKRELLKHIILCQQATM